MSIELRPMGVTCNIACQYCYQNPQRDAGNLNKQYDLEAMKAAAEKMGRPFALFGGEPLLLPMEDLEHLLAWGYEKYGRNTMQTNGVLISEAHIELFKKYKVNIGVSIDGPVELNDVRWAGSLAKTRESSRKTQRAIERLCEEGRPPALIVTLHRGNASASKLPKLCDWLFDLEQKGVRRARLHILEVDHEAVRQNYALSSEENLYAFQYLGEFQKKLTNLKLDVFGEMRSLLEGDDRKTSCVWRACDPYTTLAVQGIEGNGQRTNCGRTNKDGVDFSKAADTTYERYIGLYETSQEKGGCSGCRFFLMCKGQCPGTAIDGDWRNRTEHCDIWKSLFERLEEEMVAEGKEPLSLAADRQLIEERFLAYWRNRRNPTLHHVVEKVRSGEILSSTYDDNNPFGNEAFNRVAWVSDQARQTWELRFKIIRTELQKVNGQEVNEGEQTTSTTLWEMASHSVKGETVEEGAPIEYSIPWQLNPMLAPLGVHLLPYLAPSFDCETSIQQGTEIFDQMSNPQAKEWLATILSWPMAWSSMNGIVEIKTPLFKLSCQGEPHTGKRQVWHLGNDFPLEGAQGVNYPYKKPTKLMISDSVGFSAGIAHASCS